MMTSLTHLNDSENEIFRNTLSNQIEFINNRLNNSRIRYLNSQCKLSGTKQEIIEILNMGIAANLVHAFFYAATTCIICNRRRGEEGVRQIERAHCNNYSRPELLKMAVDDLYVDENTPIKTCDILRLFIRKHELCPIYSLCNFCHNQYDN